nr:hypothetical protein [uncultured Fibrobacter sp.]
MISDGGDCCEDDYAWILPHAGTMRTKATRCQVLSAVGSSPFLDPVGPADLQDDVRGGAGRLDDEKEGGQTG